MRLFPVHRALALGLFFLGSTGFAAAPWESTLTSGERGKFPNPRPLRATYQFGWSDLVAAQAEISYGRSNGELTLVGSGQTTGIVRALWRFDVQHRATADPATLRPLRMHQVDELRKKTLTTDLVFGHDSVVRTRTDNRTKTPPKPKRFQSPSLFDLHSALLYIRSQSLEPGSVRRIVVYPATNGYLATITVAGRENVTVGAGSYPAIKLDLQLRKIGKQRELLPHKKFRQASVWLSDDADRLLLRIEARVFVGTVFADLQSVVFTGEKPTRPPNDS